MTSGARRRGGFPGGAGMSSLLRDGYMDWSTSIGRALGLSTRRVAQELERMLRAGGGNMRCVLALEDDLARALGRLPVPVWSVGPRVRRRRKGPAQIRARVDQLPFADGCADAVITAAASVQTAATLGELARVVRDGGLVAVISRGPLVVGRPEPPEVLAAAFLHAALVDVEQRTLGSVLLSVGTVRKWHSLSLHSDGRQAPAA